MESKGTGYEEKTAGSPWGISSLQRETASSSFSGIGPRACTLDRRIAAAAGDPVPAKDVGFPALRRRRQGPRSAAISCGQPVEEQPSWRGTGIRGLGSLEDCPQAIGQACSGVRGLAVRGELGSPVRGHGLVPGSQLPVHGPDPGRMPVRQAAGLARILAQVVELGPAAVVLAEQLPGALAHGQIGEVVRSVEGVPVGRTPEEQRGPAGCPTGPRRRRPRWCAGPLRPAPAGWGPEPWPREPTPR